MTDHDHDHLKHTAFPAKVLLMAASVMSVLSVSNTTWWEGSIAKSGNETVKIYGTLWECEPAAWCRCDTQSFCSGVVTTRWVAVGAAACALGAFLLGQHSKADFLVTPLASLSCMASIAAAVLAGTSAGAPVAPGASVGGLGFCSHVGTALAALMVTIHALRARCCQRLPEAEQMALEEGRGTNSMSSESMSIYGSEGLVVPADRGKPEGTPSEEAQSSTTASPEAAAAHGDEHPAAAAAGGAEEAKETEDKPRSGAVQGGSDEHPAALDTAEWQAVSQGLWVINLEEKHVITI